MKKLTLDKTWELCLEMWKWVAKEIKLHPYSCVSTLKDKWLKTNGYGYDDVDCNCFFCHYDNSHGNYANRGNCNSCPPRKVDKSFDCKNYDCHYIKKPIAFYNKIVKLNKIRLAKKTK